MTEKAGVWHLVQDASDPTWQGWDVYGPTGLYRGNCTTLAQAKHIAQVPRVHRGLHPDPQQRHGVEFVPPEAVQPGHWRVYWYRK